MKMAVALKAGVAGVAIVGARDRDVVGASGQQWGGRASCWFPRARSGGRMGMRRKSGLRVRAAGEGVDVEVETKSSIEGDVLPSSEWPENYSVLNFQDLIAHYEPGLFKAKAQPESFLAEVMSTKIYTAFPDQALEEVDHHFSEISGLPVIDKELKCIGVLSRKDRTKSIYGGKALVRDLMTSPAITLSADKTVSDAAVLMLKNKIHRIPILNSNQQVVGIVTRTDIFTALEGPSD